MSKFNRLQFQLWDAVAALLPVLQEWSPVGCKSERQYEISLYQFLHQHLGDISVTRQFARGRAKVDLRIGNSVIVEVKTDLNKRDKLQRLIGQLTDYVSWQERIIVVLTGSTDPGLRQDLKRFIDQENSKLEHALNFVDKITLFERL